MGGALLLAVVIALTGGEEDHNAKYRVTTTWYVEPGSEDLVPIEGHRYPPIEQGGKTLVRAHVFACGPCGDESLRFVGYIEKFTDAAQKAGREDDQKTMGMLWQTGEDRLIAAPDGKEWFPPSSPEAQTIQDAPAQKCGPGKPFLQCHPPQ